MGAVTMGDGEFSGALHAKQRMTEFLEAMARFSTLSWAEVRDIITTGIWNPKTRSALFGLSMASESLGHSPAQVPNLEIELRNAVADSFHSADRIGGLSGIGSMVFNRTGNYVPWSFYNPDLLISMLKRGHFGHVTGQPGTGKTAATCELLRLYAKDNHVALSNIMPLGTVPWTYVKDARALFLAIAETTPSGNWLFALDEGGLVYSRQDAATRRSKDLDKFMRVVRKLHGAIVLIEQRPDSVPRIFQEWAKSVYVCEKVGGGTLQVLLKGDTPVSLRISDFPMTKVPYNTDDIAYFQINVNIQGLLDAVSGETEPMKAMREFILSGEGMCETCSQPKHKKGAYPNKDSREAHRIHALEQIGETET